MGYRLMWTSKEPEGQLYDHPPCYDIAHYSRLRVVKPSPARLQRSHGAAYQRLARQSDRTDPRRYVAIHWPSVSASPSLTPARPTPPVSSYRLGRRLCPSMAVKSNVLAAPKAPAIAPTAAALLSVCFKLHPPPPRLLFSACRCARIETPCSTY
jgi:hypothetical protein